jgi:2'-5' RNA ligase
LLPAPPDGLAASARWRLFVAAPLPDDAAAGLWRALAELRAAHTDARWTDPDQYHATLVFLGATNPAAVPAMATGLGEVAARWSAFDAVTGAAGGIAGGRRGGVAWLRLRDGHDELARLSLEVDEALASATYGEDFRPRPHVTLARRVDRAFLDHLHAAAPELTTRWRVERLVLYRSHTSSAGSRYEELAEYPLG